MKTLTTLLFAASITIAFNANAESDAVYGDPDIGDVFPIAEVMIQTQTPQYIADTGKEVWNASYEEYVNPADFNMSSQQTVAGLMQEMENNPPAAGRQAIGSVFVWDEVADEFQLQ
ncbi:hypothetical protein [sulfur-oxidizing endosymbiont of Gigantopelta aegis]|uniref:hypothetical protein n=1 Tax=sulfur-oxidizing endosymbiont of Gigantopelta aegis TaxID=2794934 RepID=UPI0018DE153A|nr:hypothetical protein [sulfur-oxidizing endosymbiont of Gigantopelta aegis]